MESKKTNCQCEKNSCLKSKKITLTILAIIGLIILIIALAWMYKFNYLSGKPWYDVDWNKTQNMDNIENIDTGEFDEMDYNSTDQAK